MLNLSNESVQHLKTRLWEGKVPLITLWKKMLIVMDVSREGEGEHLQVAFNMEDG